MHLTALPIYDYDKFHNLNDLMAHNAQVYAAKRGTPHYLADPKASPVGGRDNNNELAANNAAMMKSAKFIVAHHRTFPGPIDPKTGEATKLPLSKRQARKFLRGRGLTFMATRPD